MLLKVVVDYFSNILKDGINPPKRLFATTQPVNLPACSPHCLFNAERQAAIPTFESLYFTQLGIELLVYHFSDT